MPRLYILRNFPRVLGAPDHWILFHSLRSYLQRLSDVALHVLATHACSMGSVLVRARTHLPLLLPDLPPDSVDAAQQILLYDMPPLPQIYHDEPVMFVATLRGVQHYRFTPDERIRLLRKLDTALKSYDEEDWTLLFHTEVISVTLQLVFENEFCGYTKEDVLSWGADSPRFEDCIVGHIALLVLHDYTDVIRQPYLLCLLEVLRTCLDRLLAVRKRRGGHFDEWRSDIERETRVVLTSSVAFWKVFFELRGPLFCPAAKAAINGAPDMLGTALLPLIHSLFTLQDETQYVPTHESSTSGSP